MFIGDIEEEKNETTATFEEKITIMKYINFQLRKNEVKKLLYN